MPGMEQRRQDMVKDQLLGRDISDPTVLEAMARVPREEFVPEYLRDMAYADSPLAIGQGQTISQPYVVALMTEALELSPADRVLEIGTGSGYAAALLGQIVSEVYTVERHEALAEAAAERFRRLGYDNVHVLHADGTLGWPEHAPYDAIVVTAGGPQVPDALREQLAVGGRLVIPVGPTLYSQELIRLRRVGPGRFRRENLGAVRFVPLVGEGGWEP
jgi:protein-L-isoaspartate(D-aspartate) O-methyltransferase